MAKTPESGPDAESIPEPQPGLDTESSRNTESGPDAESGLDPESGPDAESTTSSAVTKGRTASTLSAWRPAAARQQLLPVNDDDDASPAAAPAAAWWWRRPQQPRWNPTVDDASGRRRAPSHRGVAYTLQPDDDATSNLRTPLLMPDFADVHDPCTGHE